jgi:two-component system, OmpR family, response regulator ChvI
VIYNRKNNNNDNHSRRILIVDDEPDICLTFKRGIEDYNGYKVDTYDKPHQALQDFKSGIYDLILLDIKMPHINGFQLYSLIKKIDSQVKIMFITAAETFYEQMRDRKGQRREEKEGNSGNLEYRDFCKFNNDMFIQKPIQLKDLVSRIDAVLAD